jgi:hypothetical protein
MQKEDKARREESCGTRGRTRTDTLLRAGDFESPVSTNFTTLAKRAPLYQ